MLLLREYETWLSAHRQHALSIGGNGALHTHRNSYLQAFVFRQLGFLFVHFNCMWLRLHYIYNWMFVLLAVWHCSIRISFSTFCFLFSKLLMLLNFVVPAILICLWKWDECWTRTTADFWLCKKCLLCGDGARRSYSSLVHFHYIYARLFKNWSDPQHLACKKKLTARFVVPSWIVSSLC